MTKREDSGPNSLPDSCTVPQMLRATVWQIEPIETGSAMPPVACENLVIGGGVMGLSIAYHLAKEGLDTVLVEQDHIGNGASGRNAGLFLPSMAEREALAHTVGFLDREQADIGLKPAGHAALAVDDRTEKLFCQEAERRAAGGADAGAVELLSREAGARRCGLELAGNVRAVRWYGGGHTIDPWRFLSGLAAACRHAGVVIAERWKARAIERRGAQLIVRGGRGDITARRVFVATGAWTPRLLEAIGKVMSPRPGYMFATGPSCRPAAMPGMAVGFGSAYWRQTADGRIVGGGSDAPRGARARDAEETLQERVARKVARACPQFRGMAIAHAWTGHFDETADGRPLIGPLDAGARLFILAGFGGHGLPPALGSARQLVGQALGKPVHRDGKITDPLRFREIATAGF